MSVISGRVEPGDARYADLVRKRFNKRSQGRPEYVQLVGSAADVVKALDDAVPGGKRVVACSGGHCLEGFVSDPAVQVVIDTSMMKELRFDEAMGAFAIDAGLTLGEVYRRLFLGWGVVLPAGESPDLGVGGHVLGGAFGFLCREHGLAVDYLCAVEVVVVDASGKAQVVVATREESDPNRELWWAHTGGGGGNFGIVTRYWFRAPDAAGGTPAALLPRAPEKVRSFKATWDWQAVTEADFSALMRNYGAWCEANAAPDAASTTLFSILSFARPPNGTITVRGIDIGGEAESRVDAYLAALADGVRASAACEASESSWLQFALNPFPDLFAVGPGGVSASQGLLKLKDAFLRLRHTEEQIAIAYDYLTRKHPQITGGGLGFATYGGRVSSVAADATASAQREAVMTTSYSVGWQNAQDEQASLRWVRELYRDLFAATGGVPVPGPRSDGALINHPDVDLADPAWNQSGVGFGTLYYKDNYPRLQRAKAKWDPRDVFHHALSIEKP